MITDNLKNAETYYGISTRIAQALRYLKENDFSKMSPGRYEIDGVRIYALVQSYESIPEGNGSWEAHKKYIDIQYVIEGSELIGYSNMENLTVSREYSDDGDYMLLEGNGNHIRVNSGSFAIFYPQDAHMPCLAVSEPRHIRKVVVKVHV